MADQQAANGAEWPSWLAWAKESTTSLGPLLERFAQDEETELVKTLGPPGKPHTAVVKMSDCTARRYQQAFQNDYLFERNAPLHPQAEAS